MNNLITVLVMLVELAPTSGKWVIDRMVWSMVSQIVSLTGDIRGSKNTADWVEPQRTALLSLLGRLLDIANIDTALAVRHVEGHISYLESKQNRALVVAEDQVALMKAAGTSDAVIAEHISKMNKKNKLTLGIKQKAIADDRNAFSLEVEKLVTDCAYLPMHETEIDNLNLKTQLFLANGIQRQLDERSGWLMSNIMYQAGELTLLNVFINARYAIKLIHGLEEAIEQEARAGYERTEEVG